MDGSLKKSPNAFVNEKPQRVEDRDDMVKIVNRVSYFDKSIFVNMKAGGLGVVEKVIYIPKAEKTPAKANHT